jgi:uncharacterized OB-fold protein
METNRCEKCGKETCKNKKICENCKKSRNEKWINLGKNALLTLSGIAIAVVTKDKIKPRL